MNTVYISTGILILLLVFFNLYHWWKNRNKIICVNESDCAGCRCCIKRCSRHVLEMVEDEIGIHAKVQYPDKCTACGNCLGKCKFNALKLVKRI
jgi:Na+-translocating ferredoxin:NAD+ oxidoreductase RNF subunit RnfB